MLSVSPKTIIWVIIVIYGIYLTFKDPFYGVLLYVFEFFTHPHYRYWGKVLPAINYPKIFASILVISFIINYSKIKQKYSLEQKTGFLLLFLFWVNMYFVYSFSAVNQGTTFKAGTEFFQIIIMYYISVITMNSEKKINLFLLLLILGNLHFAYEAWGKSLSAGRLEGVGGAGTRDANHLANDMLAAIPLLGAYLIKGTKSERILAILAAPFLLNTLILCNSRGAYLGLITSGVVFLLMSKKQHTKFILPAMVAGVILFFNLADQRFFTRFSTISTYEEEGSAMGRIEAWKGALVMINDFPLGAGYKGFAEMSPVYIPDAVKSKKTGRLNVHNTLLYTLTSWGVQGAIIFALFHGSVYLALFRAKRYAKETKNDRLLLLTVATIAGLTGFWVAAMFGVREQSNLLFWLAGISMAMQNVYNVNYRASGPVGS